MENKEDFVYAFFMESVKLEDQLRVKIRRLGMAFRTEQSYVSWYKRYVKFHDLKHPRELGKEDVEEFLNYLVGEKKVAAGTLNQAFNALIFLYREVLRIELEGINAARPKLKKSLPESILSDLESQLDKVRIQYEGDPALGRKAAGKFRRSWEKFWGFPS